MQEDYYKIVIFRVENLWNANINLVIALLIITIIVIHFILLSIHVNNSYTYSANNGVDK